jgi:hypothetical protein
MHSADEILELLSVVYATGDTLEVSCINLHREKKTNITVGGCNNPCLLSVKRAHGCIICLHTVVDPMHTVQDWKARLELPNRCSTCSMRRCHQVVG